MPHNTETFIERESSVLPEKVLTSVIPGIYLSKKFLIYVKGASQNFKVKAQNFFNNQKNQVFAFLVCGHIALRRLLKNIKFLVPEHFKHFVVLRGQKNSHFIIWELS